MPKRVVVIADREPHNLRSIIEHERFHPEDYQLAGVIAPFQELDREIVKLVQRLPDIEGAQVIPGGEISAKIDLAVDDRPDDLVFWKSNGQELLYLHAPYIPKLSDDDRVLYQCGLVERLNMMKPDVIVMANYKYVIPLVPLAFPGQMLNWHPSVLPRLEGWRPEKRALEGEFPEFAGYTAHIAESHLDSGPTLFSQRVIVDGHTEESLRTAIIQAQSSYAARILAMYCSDRPRKTVGWKAALEIEERDISDLGLLSRGERESFMRSYRRVLFKSGGSYRPMETFFEPVDPIELPDVTGYQMYRLFIPGDSQASMQTYLSILEAVDRRVHKTWVADNGFERDARIWSFSDLGPILDTFGIPYEIHTFPYKATASRRIREPVLINPNH